MLIELFNVELSIFETDLKKSVAKYLDLPLKAIQHLSILRRNLDARNHRNIKFTYRFLIDIPDLKTLPNHPNCREYKPASLPPALNLEKSDLKPIVVGAGPAGLFAALAFAECGLQPILVEQGKDVSGRAEDVQKFWSEGKLNPFSNMYFGEGGAGTFSDGKLNTRTRRPESSLIMRELINAGAPPEIEFDAKPHLGTDVLLKMLPRLRERLRNLGVTFHFNSRLSEIRRGRQFPEVCINDEWIQAAPLVLAGGHSSFGIYRMLHAIGAPLTVKGNAFGFRIEHPADFITRRFYGKNKNVHRILGNCGYNLSAKVNNNCSVYSFCCCPGGEVVSCSATENSVSANGMSFSHRNAPFTNAGFVASIQPEEFAPDPMHALHVREQYERACFEAGQRTYGLPVQRAKDFLNETVGKDTPEVSCRCACVPGNLNSLLPEFLLSRLKAGLQAMDSRIPGWIANGVLIGLETTTSSPVRIERTASMECVELPGILPVGEGSGYAGGIMTSAMDGYHCVHQWLENYHS